MRKFAFVLGREYKLALAEIGSIFGWENIIQYDRDIALIKTDKNLDAKTLHTLGGTLRIIKIQEAKTSFKDSIEAHLKKIQSDKIAIAISCYGGEIERKNLASALKSTLKKSGKNIRYIGENTKNINAGSWKKNRLGKYQTEYNIITLDENEFFGVTIACQDVDAYARRDIAKIRDMQVGMMPPKLVQMMINIITHNGKQKFSQKGFTSVNDGDQKYSDDEIHRAGAIYDPFCGLGTTLIEAIDMGYKQVYGSDISPEMVHNSKESVEKFVEEEQEWQTKIREKGGIPRHDISTLKYDIWNIDAQKIDTSVLWDLNDTKNIYIVSEGFLGEIVTKKSFSKEKIQAIRNDLKVLYSGFFNGLKCRSFDGKIIMSFPFWKQGETCIYFREIYEIIRENGFEIVPMIPEEYNLNTKENTLLYARKSHIVGREIIVIQRKIQ